MPEWLHKELTQLAAKKGLKGENKESYVYGTLNKYKKNKAKARQTALRDKLGG